MKRSFLLLFILLTGSVVLKAQKTYEIIPDTVEVGQQILKGIITKEDLTSDSSYNKWYTESLRIYKRPDSSALAAFKQNKDKIYFIAFAGTWCEDSHFILPKFFKIQEESGFPENRITLIATDRNKHATGNIAEALHITNVPSILVIKDGKEIGRLIEYGATGYWDKGLAKIINQQK